MLVFWIWSVICLSLLYVTGLPPWPLPLAHSDVLLIHSRGIAPPPSLPAGGISPDPTQSGRPCGVPLGPLRLWLLLGATLPRLVPSSRQASTLSHCGTSYLPSHLNASGGSAQRKGREGRARQPASWWSSERLLLQGKWPFIVPHCWIRWPSILGHFLIRGTLEGFPERNGC